MLEGNILVKKYPSESLVVFSFVGDFVDPDYISDLVNPTINEFKNIVFDVQKLEYINSASFGKFFELASNIDQNRSNLRFMNINKKFKIIYESLGATKFFKVISSLKDL